jgi:hypothetical protein
MRYHCESARENGIARDLFFPGDHANSREFE